MVERTGGGHTVGSGGGVVTTASPVVADDVVPVRRYVRILICVVALFVVQAAFREGAVVRGTITRSVVWPGSTVARGEVLVDAIRAGTRTVLVR